MYHWVTDMNADVGEGIGNEAELMPYLSSCNIACGGHAGDDESMEMVIRLAKQHKVKIGAHPSYPDPENFGRKDMDIPCAALYSSIKGQIKALMRILRQERAQLHHIKPHGALYNRAAVDCDTATIILEAIKSIPMPVKLYVPFGSVIARQAQEEGIRITYEAFADRNYRDDLTLVPRSEPDALITDLDEMAEHVLTMIKRGVVRTINGNEIEIQAQTFCVHGDNPKALKLLKGLRQILDDQQVKIR
ncbi:MAG: 5-oxoprolinase subunit PxpA [Bacteroidia bacterium]|nr:5-oxoprolinase subunit PxpA [Bacteroidia bacterium]NNK69270.1 5-oxoprolinase subunit PxpA [Flavobacteriaceae bacterium]